MDNQKITEIYKRQQEKQKEQEKLYEELLISGEPRPTQHPKIYRSVEDFLPWSEMNEMLHLMKDAIKKQDQSLVNSLLQKLVPDFHHS